MADGDKVSLKDICDVQVLTEAWRQIHRGLDREGLVLDVVQNVDYEGELESNLGRLVRSLKNHNYRPSPGKEIPFAKGMGLTRPTVILDVEDAIICQAIAWKIAPLLDSKLISGVYSMRATKNKRKPFKNWYDEWPRYQQRIRTVLGGEYECLVVADITAFFDNLDLRILKELLIDAGVSLDMSDLVVFMLDAWMYRPLYGVPMGRGIPQADWDLPRALANFYLYRHDHRMEDKCGNNYVRWVDDMNVVVENELEGKRVIGYMNDSLRRLFLTVNLAKTKILPNMDEVKLHFWFEENDFLTDIEKKTKKVAKGELARETILDELVSRYRSFSTAHRTGNWDKVLKRYYTMFKRINSDYLVPQVNEHLCELPQLDDKISDYVREIDYSSQAASEVIRYLQSPESLYPSVEMRLLNLLLDLRVPGSESRMVEGIRDLGMKYVYGQDPFSDRHWYSRCLGTLLLAKYGQISDIRRLAEFLTNSGDQLESSELKKHLLAVAFMLPSGDPDQFRAIQFSKGQHDRELSRLIHFYEGLFNMAKGPVPNRVKRRLVLRQTDSPRHRYLGFRTFILLRIIAHNPVFHSQLRSICRKLQEDNEDPIINGKLTRLLEEIS